MQYGNCLTFGVWWERMFGLGSQVTTGEGKVMLLDYILHDPV